MTQLFINTFEVYLYCQSTGMFSDLAIQEACKFIYSLTIFTIACDIQLIHNELNPVVTVTSTEELCRVWTRVRTDVWTDMEVREINR